MKPRAPFAALSLPLASLAAADGARHQPVVLIPDGQFAASDGRPQGLPGWRLDGAIAARLIRRVQGRKTKLVVNYEHAEPVGAPLPAAGWIDPASLAYVPGTGLTAQVDWLPKARDMLAQGEYAYLSPVIRYDATSGAVLDLLLAGLTNTPALDVLPALSARLRLAVDDLDDGAAPAGNDRLTPLSPGLNPPEDPLMSLDLAKLRHALGLAADAPADAILTQAAALAAAAGQVPDLEAQLSALSADKDALGAQVAALTTQAAASPGATPDPTHYVPKAVYDEAVATLRTLAVTNDAAELERLLQQGLTSGQIVGQAQAEWLKGQGLAALRAYLDGAPAVVALTRTQTQGQERIARLHSRAWIETVMGRLAQAGGLESPGFIAGRGLKQYLIWRDQP